MAEKKFTKVEKFEMIRDILVGDGSTEMTEQTGMLVDFVDSQIEQIQAKAEKSKERAAAKKAEGDELRKTVQSLLTDEYQSIDDIFTQIDDEDVTLYMMNPKSPCFIKDEEENYIYLILPVNFNAATV